MMSRRRALMMAQGGAIEPDRYPFYGVEWRIKSRYNPQTGISESSGGYISTEKKVIKTSSCYKFQGTGTDSFPLFWDENGNFIGSYMQYSDNISHIYCKAGWTYAYQIHTDDQEAPSRFDTLVELVNAGQSQIEKASIKISELTWNVSSNVLEANVTNIFGGNVSSAISRTKNVNHQFFVCPSYLRFSTCSVSKDPLAFFLYYWRGTALLSARYWGTDLSSALSYYQENNTTLDINF